MIEAPVKIMVANYHFKCLAGLTCTIKECVSPMLPDHLLVHEHSFKKAVRMIPPRTKLFKVKGKHVFKVEWLYQVGETNKNIGMSENMI